MEELIPKWVGEPRNHETGLTCTIGLVTSRYRIGTTTRHILRLVLCSSTSARVCRVDAYNLVMNPVFGVEIIGAEVAIYIYVSSPCMMVAQQTALWEIHHEIMYSDWGLITPNHNQTKPRMV